MAYTEPHTAIRAKYANFGPSLNGRWLFYALAGEFEEPVKNLKASVIERSQSLVDAIAELADDSADYIEGECDAFHEASGGDFCSHLAQQALSDIGRGSGNAAVSRAMARAVAGSSTASRANSRARSASKKVRREVIDNYPH